jgi:hypothetical protein
MSDLRPISEPWDLPEEAVATPVEPADRPLLGLLLVGLLIDLAVFAFVVVKGFVKQPYSDMFDYLQQLFAWESHWNLFGYLSALHNGQHLVWVRALTLMDVRLFHGTSVVFAATSSLAVILSAALAMWVVWRTVPARAVGAAAALLCGMLIVTTINAVDCTQAINAVYPITFALAVTAILLFERGVGAPDGDIAPLAALPIAVGALFGNAVGLAVWPVLALSALRARRYGMLTLAAVLGAVFIGLFWHDANSAPPGYASLGGGAHIAKMIRYFLLYCGMPWSQIGILAPLRLAIGAVVGVIGAGLVARGPRLDGRAGRIERIGLDLTLLALVTAVMAAVGRVDESADVVVPVRYAIFMSALHVGVVCLIAARLTLDWPAARRWVTVVAGVAVVVLLGQQVAAGASALRSSVTVRGRIAAFNAGQRTPEMLQLIHRDLNFAARMTDEYRRRGLYK